jgi:hypothetical protein
VQQASLYRGYQKLPVVEAASGLVARCHARTHLARKQPHGTKHLMSGCTSETLHDGTKTHPSALPQSEP